MKAQLFYQDSHLFVGPKPINWSIVGNEPQVFIGPNWGIEYYESRVESVSIRSSGDETSNEAIFMSGAVLYQNTPNPASAGTTIAYELPENYSSANLFIYNMAGVQVKNYTLAGSPNNVKIAANELSVGTYIYTLTVDGKKIDTKKMILN